MLSRHVCSKKIGRVPRILGDLHGKHVYAKRLLLTKRITQNDLNIVTLVDLVKLGDFTFFQTLYKLYGDLRGRPFILGY